MSFWKKKNEEPSPMIQRVFTVKLTALHKDYKNASFPVRVQGRNEVELKSNVRQFFKDSFDTVGIASVGSAIQRISPKVISLYYMVEMVEEGDV